MKFFPMKKHSIHILFKGFVRGLFLIGCLIALILNSCRELPQNPVVVLFDNDVHCAVEGYAAMLALKQQKLQETPYVATVSCGDFVQGDVIGVISRGEKVIDIMNHVGYDFVTLGNHEFFYDVYGHFIFQEKKNYLNSSYTPIKELNGDLYFSSFNQGAPAYYFEDDETIISFNNNPKFDNIKNDFVVWG